MREFKLCNAVGLEDKSVDNKLYMQCRNTTYCAGYARKVCKEAYLLNMFM